MNDAEISFADLCSRNKILCVKIARVKDWQLKRDLLQLSKTCDEYRREVNKEEVNCRQQLRISTKYQKILKQYHESVEMLEQHLVEAMIRDS